MVDTLRTAGWVAIACGSPSPAVPADQEPMPSLHAAVASAEAPDALRKFSGKYAFAGGTAEREALQKAIDDVVAEMNPLVRGIARSRLLGSNAIAEAIAIDAEGDTITVVFDKRSYTAAIDGSPVTVTGVDGDPLVLTHRLHGKRLVQTFDGDRGIRRNAFVLRGNKLALNVTVQSDQLPSDLVYTLTFARR